MSAPWVSWKLKVCLAHSCPVVQVVELVLVERGEGASQAQEDMGRLLLSLHLQVMCKSQLSSGN